jgi:predicted TIM-barrel fold metal-dependent hydrolase
MQMAMPFYHGLRDIPAVAGEEKGGYAQKKDGYSPNLQQHVVNIGIVKVMVHYLSQYLHCEPTLEAVTAARNERTKKDLAGYTKELYEDQHIIAEVADLPNPMNDPLLQQCFPVKLLRLYQMEPLIYRLLKECPDLDKFMDAYSSSIRHAKSDGFVSIKCHVLEIVTCDIHDVDRGRAATLYAGAKNGEESAFNEFYLYVFAQTLLLSQELDLPVHIHTGCTGGPGNGILFNLDPWRMGPFLNDEKYRLSKIVFLHSSVPEFGKTALLTHAFPNVWVCMSCVLPWSNINFAQCLEDVLGCYAPWDKILLGSGQHDNPEMVWCASKTAKSALAYIMDKAVSMNMLSHSQAQEAAEMILYKNALNLYHL